MTALFYFFLLPLRRTRLIKKKFLDTTSIFIPYKFAFINHALCKTKLEMVNNPRLDIAQSNGM